MPSLPPLILASQSPRRAQLLRDAGLVFEQRSPPFEDPDQPPGELTGSEAEGYAIALAKRKAASLAPGIDPPRLILAADTICIDDQGRLVGKPTDRDDAERMLRAFVNTTHRVVTGVALLRVGGPELSQAHDRREAHADTAWACRGVYDFADTATVSFGPIGDDALRRYLASDDWQGKAGGYNLFDRLAAGWPIEVTGDPSTVVGLPMRRLTAVLGLSD